MCLMKIGLVGSALCGGVLLAACGVRQSQEPASAPPRHQAAPDPDARQLELKKPIERDGRYVLEFGKTVLEVEPKVGGRIARFAYDGKNVLIGPDTHENWGSTYWTSPQKDWGWPPVPEIDEEPFSVSLEGDTIVLKSKPAHVLRPSEDGAEGPAEPGKLVTIEKRITPVLKDEAVDITYVIHNQGSEPIELASWEISRVAAGGLSFYPKGEGIIADRIGDFDVFPFTQQHDIVWFDQRKANYSGHTKLAADAGAGWLAHVTPERLLFLKQFQNVPKDAQAPGEGEVELFGNSSKKEDGTPDTQYVEVENQGSYETIAAGGQQRYKVRWMVRPLPKDVEDEAGSDKLVSYVRNLVSPAD